MSGSGEVIQALVPRAADSKRESLTLSSLLCSIEALREEIRPFHKTVSFVQEGLEKTKEKRKERSTIYQLRSSVRKATAIQNQLFHPLAAEQW